MPSRYAWIALGVGAYLAFAVSTFPAGTAYRLFAPDTIRMSGIEGTVWTGRAALASAAGIPLRELRWTLSALPLFIGRASGHVAARLSDGFVDADVSASPSRVVLTNVQLSTSVGALAAVVPVGAAQGLISVALDRVELVDGWPVTIAGGGRIGDLAVPPLIPGQQGGLIPLGSYELTFENTGGQGVFARFNDTGGPLEVMGSLVLDPARQYLLEGVAATRPNAPRELVQGLDLMTEEMPDGKRRFELSGSL